MTFCTQCGSSSYEGARFCAKCGKAISSTAPDALGHRDSFIRDDFRATSPPVLLSGTTDNRQRKAYRAGGHSPEPNVDEEAWAAYIGSKKQSYYLERFRRQSKGGSALWHWPSLFLTWYWMLYRKMWPQSVIYFALPFAIGVSFALVMAVNETFGAALYVAVLIAFFLLPPMLANRLYWRRALATMAEFREKTTTRDQYLGALGAKGGTSGIALAMVVVLFTIANLGVLAAVALPAYHDYTKRALVSQISIHGNEAARKVAEMYTRTHKIAGGVEELGIAPLNLQGVSIRISPKDGTVLYMKGDLGTVEFQPAIEKDGSISVVCRSPDIRQNWLPRVCRQQS